MKCFKISQNFKLLFSMILGTFDLATCGQTSLKAGFVVFGLIFMKLKKLKGIQRETKKLDFHKTSIFSLFKSFPTTG